MEMADLPVAFGPKMADQLSASLSHQKKRVFESTPGIGTLLQVVLLKENKRDLLRNFMNVVFLNIR